MEKRKPPAFQIYASDDLASSQYFGLTLAERGLLDAMRRAAWVDNRGTVPKDPDELALVIRRPVEEVRNALSDGMLSWFVAAGKGRLIEPELKRQMTTCIARRQAQVEAANKTNAARKRRKRHTQTDTVSVSLTDSVSATVLNGSEGSGDGLRGWAPSGIDFEWE